MWGRNARARWAWASADTSRPAPGQVLPPPIPGGSTVYYFAAENGSYPWAMGGYAGARSPLLALIGGVVVVPDVEAGLVQLRAWWPFATALHVIRVLPDGTRQPVRGAYAWPVPEATRRNQCLNPSVEVGLDGYLPAEGNPTLTRIAAPADVPSVSAGTYALRATIATAGACAVRAPNSLTGSAPVTFGFAAKMSARPSTLGAQITSTDVNGTNLTPIGLSLTADQTNESVGQWGRQVLRFTPPVGALTIVVKIVALDLPAGATLDLDAITIEQATTDGSWFDGGSLGAQWIGTPGLSESVLAPVQTVLDRECPLDLDVSYMVVSPGLTGGRVTSGVVQLPSLWRTWLTHPDPNMSPMRVDLTKTPALEFGAEQGVFWPLGATRPVVISALRRQSPTGSVVFNVSGWAERDQLRELLDDMSPVLLRAPAAYGLGPGQWLSLGAVTEDRGERKAWQDAAQVSATFVEVDPPDLVT